MNLVFASGDCELLGSGSPLLLAAPPQHPETLVIQSTVMGRISNTFVASLSEPPSPLLS